MKLELSKEWAANAAKQEGDCEVGAGAPTLRRKLDDGEKHMLRLIRKDQNAEGWAKVSEAVWPVAVMLPSELVELRSTVNLDGGVKVSNRAIRLTDAGNAVVDWLL